MRKYFILIFLLLFLSAYKSRSFSFSDGEIKTYKITYGVKIERIKGRFRYFRLGLPIFLNNFYQKVLNYKISFPPYKTVYSSFHKLKYFVFDIGDYLNLKNRISIAIELTLEKRKRVINLKKAHALAENKNPKVYKEYTLANSIIQKDHAYAKDFAKRVIKLRSMDKLVKIFNHVRSFLRYSPRYPRYQSFSNILRRRKGDCGDYSIFLVTLLRAAGFPARCVTGRVLKKTLRGSWHAWAECYIKPFGWIPLDPANFEVRDAAKLIGYMPYEYVATHYGLNVLLPGNEQVKSLPVIQTYYYFQKSYMIYPVRYSFNFLWNIKEI